MCLTGPGVAPGSAFKNATHCNLPVPFQSLHRWSASVFFLTAVGQLFLHGSKMLQETLKALRAFAVELGITLLSSYTVAKR